MDGHRSSKSSDVGSSPTTPATWVCSLIGKASALQAERCRFKSDQYPLMVSEVEVVETLACEVSR